MQTHKPAAELAPGDRIRTRAGSGTVQSATVGSSLVRVEFRDEFGKAFVYCRTDDLIPMLP